MIHTHIVKKLPLRITRATPTLPSATSIFWACSNWSSS